MYDQLIQPASPSHGLVDGLLLRSQSRDSASSDDGDVPNGQQLVFWGVELSRRVRRSKRADHDSGEGRHEATTASSSGSGPGADWLAPTRSPSFERKV